MQLFLSLWHKRKKVTTFHGNYQKINRSFKKIYLNQTKNILEYIHNFMSKMLIAQMLKKNIQISSHEQNEAILFQIHFS